MFLSDGDYIGNLYNQPSTDFLRDTDQFMSHLKDSDFRSIIAVNEKPVDVVMDANLPQEAQDQLEYAQTVAGIRKGLSQALAGAGLEASDFFATLK